MSLKLLLNLSIGILGLLFAALEIHNLKLDATCSVFVALFLAAYAIVLVFICKSDVAKLTGLAVMTVRTAALVLYLKPVNAADTLLIATQFFVYLVLTMVVQARIETEKIESEMERAERAFATVPNIEDSIAALRNIRFVF
ncbi:unnamed protein product [Caenorhabditis sp. 36 PRJEB53466]|nr:unnamed protein product [Caenorhabditis sp. 36 PRJEB53466]